MLLLRLVSLLYKEYSMILASQCVGSIGRMKEWNVHNKLESIKAMPRLQLCLSEKYEIASCKGDNLLNKRTEILVICRSRSKYAPKILRLKKTDVINQSHNVIKDALALTLFYNVLLCNLFS